MAMVTKESIIQDVLEQLPNSVDIFESYGLNCANCMASQRETIEQAAAGHDVDLNSIIDALNQKHGS
jgi:hybrid cluster-associated redox disulfide protein